MPGFVGNQGISTVLVFDTNAPGSFVGPRVNIQSVVRNGVGDITANLLEPILSTDVLTVCFGSANVTRVDFLSPSQVQIRQFTGGGAPADGIVNFALLRIANH